MALTFSTAFSKYCMADVINGELVISGWGSTKVFQIDGNLMNNLVNLGIKTETAKKIANWAQSQT